MPQWRPLRVSFGECAEAPVEAAYQRPPPLGRHVGTTLAAAPVPGQRSVALSAWRQDWQSVAPFHRSSIPSWAGAGGGTAERLACLLWPPSPALKIGVLLVLDLVAHPLNEQVCNLPPSPQPGESVPPQPVHQIGLFRWQEASARGGVDVVSLGHP